MSIRFEICLDDERLDYYYADDPHETSMKDPTAVVSSGGMYIRDPLDTLYYKVEGTNITRRQLAEHVSDWLHARTVYYHVQRSISQSADLTQDQVSLDMMQEIAVHSLEPTSEMRNGLVVYQTNLSRV